MMPDENQNKMHPLTGQTLGSEIVTMAYVRIPLAKVLRALRFPANTSVWEIRAFLPTYQESLRRKTSLAPDTVEVLITHPRLARVEEGQQIPTMTLEELRRI